MDITEVYKILRVSECGYNLNCIEPRKFNLRFIFFILFILLFDSLFVSVINGGCNLGFFCGCYFRLNAELALINMLWPEGCGQFLSDLGRSCHVGELS